jgi:hypothetical protein
VAEVELRPYDERLISQLTRSDEGCISIRSPLFGFSDLVANIGRHFFYERK